MTVCKQACQSLVAVSYRLGLLSGRSTRISTPWTIYRPFSFVVTSLLNAERIPVLFSCIVLCARSISLLDRVAGKSSVCDQQDGCRARLLAADQGTRTSSTSCAGSCDRSLQVTLKSPHHTSCRDLGGTDLLVTFPTGRTECFRAPSWVSFRRRYNGCLPHGCNAFAERGRLTRPCSIHRILPCGSVSAGPSFRTFPSRTFWERSPRARVLDSVGPGGHG